MIWPPIKAWTSKLYIEGQVHFVAINYGGELKEKWVILMSVVDSLVVVKVLWSELVSSSNWESGWVEINYLESSNLFNNKGDVKTIECFHPSTDSGLTIPISKNTIRPWLEKI